MDSRLGTALAGFAVGAGLLIVLRWSMDRNVPDLQRQLLHQYFQEKQEQEKTAQLALFEQMKVLFNENNMNMEAQMLAKELEKEERLKKLEQKMDQCMEGLAQLNKKMDELIASQAQSNLLEEKKWNELSAHLIPSLTPGVEKQKENQEPKKTVTRAEIASADAQPQHKQSYLSAINRKSDSDSKLQCRKRASTIAINNNNSNTTSNNAATATRRSHGLPLPNHAVIAAHAAQIKAAENAASAEPQKQPDETDATSNDIIATGSPTSPKAGSFPAP